MSDTIESTPGARPSRRGQSSGAAELMAMVSAAGPWAVRVAATLRLADHLVSGPRELPAIARATGADPDALGRLLRFLACRGIFEETAPDTFRANAAARMLCEGHPSGLRSWLEVGGAAARMDATWSRLLESVESGGPAYVGARGGTFWDDLAADPRLAGSFHDVMSIGVRGVARDLARHYRWSEAGSVADLGGGDGTLLAEVLQAHPHLRGCLVDLPSAAEAAQRTIAAAGLEGRCAVVRGDLFERPPPGHDVYVLANVLHDWNDAQAAAILRQSVTVAGRDGRVLIVERVRSAANARAATEDDLRFLLIYGGRSRTRAQFEALAAAAGLEVAAVTEMPSGFAVVECMALEMNGDPR